MRCVNVTVNFLCPGIANGHLIAGLDKCYLYIDKSQQKLNQFQQYWLFIPRKKAHFFRSRYPDGGRILKCEGNEIVHLDFDTYTWYCSEDHPEACPGLGGFKLGCSGGNIDVPPLECDFTENTLGECGCDGQIFVDETCTKSHLCTSNIPEGSSANVDGCHLDCPEGERVIFDFAGKQWGCEAPEADYVCTGKFQTDCHVHGDGFDIMCNCGNEIWVNNNCEHAFVCTAPNNGGTNDGYYLTCPDGEVINIDLSSPQGYTCTQGSESCPGSYHFGCEGGDIGQFFTPPPGTGNASAMTPANAFWLAFIPFLLCYSR